MTKLFNQAQIARARAATLFVAIPNNSPLLSKLVDQLPDKDRLMARKILEGNKAQP